MLFNVYLDESDKTVYAELSPGEGEPVSQLALLVKLEDIGFKSLHLPPNIVNELVANSQEEKACRLALKTIVDATASVLIAADKQQAFLTLTVADGGAELTLETIQQTIQEAGVVEELVQIDVVERCVEQKKVENMCFAQARLPIQGEDAKYLPLVESEIVVPPSVDEHGVADMMNTHQFQIVEVATPLMRRIPPAEGTAGMDVVGTELNAAIGNDPGFMKDMPGTIMSPDDSDLLIAGIKGHPVILPNGVKVDSTLHVDSVDIDTGNINFDGSLEVRGEVVPGMTIDVTGDVYVKGSVERSTIKAGGSITIAGGVFGAEKEAEKNTFDWKTLDEEEQEAVQYELHAAGNVHAKFVNLSSIYAGFNVVVKEYIGNSTVKSDNEILLGQEGGKGVLYGGMCESVKKIAVNRLGTESYVLTCVKVGDLERLSREYRLIEKSVKKRVKESDQLKQILATIKKQGAPDTLGKLQLDKARKIINTITAIDEKVEGLESQLLLLNEQIEKHKKAKLEVVKAVFPNVVININGKVKKVAENMRGCCLVLRGNEIAECDEGK